MRTNRFRNRIAALALAAGAWFAAGSATAAPIVIDFDDLAAGSIVTDIGDVTFSSNIAGFDLIASDRFAAASGMNYLGVDDGGAEVFFPGDALILDFAIPISSIAVAFIATPLASGFTLSTVLGSTVSGNQPDVVLADGGGVFEVSFRSPLSFDRVRLFGGTGVDSFNIDNIAFETVAISEPSTLLLCCLGLAAIFSGRRHSQSTERSSFL